LVPEGAYRNMEKMA